MRKDVTIVTILLSLLFCFMAFALLYFGEVSIIMILQSLFIIIMGIFAIGNLRSKMVGLPTEDELSKKIKEKAAAYAFYSSFGLWIILSIANNYMKLKYYELVGFGGYGMAALFGIFWLFFRFKGKVNE